MKKKITFKMWLTVFFGGIWQFFRKIFTWKNKTLFVRVLGLVVTICLVAITSMMAYAFYDQYMARYRHWKPVSYRLGEDFVYYDEGKGNSYIENKRSGEIILKGLDWIARSEDGDSLVVFAKDGKRGYLSKKSGKIIIPAKYDAAWCFNDGVAGVCLGDSVFFIDHSGKPINSRKYKRAENHNYTYHGKLVAFVDKGKTGLADRNGTTVIPPKYEKIMPAPNRMWNVVDNGKVGTLNSEAKQVIPCEYKKVNVYPQGGIIAVSEDNSKKRYEYNGDLVDDFVYDYIEALSYESEELDSDNNRISKPANLSVYNCEGSYGLIDKKGNPVTPPIYSNIRALSADRYECQITFGGERIIIKDE